MFPTMESADSIKCPASGDSRHEGENHDPCDSGSLALVPDSRPSNCEVKDDISGEVLGTVTDNPFETGVETAEADLLPLNSEVKDEINGEAPGTIFDGLDEDMDISSNSEEDANNITPSGAVDFEVSESVAVVNAMTSTCSVNSENGSLAIQSEEIFQSEEILSNHKKRGILSSIRETDTGSFSGAKRPRLTVDEHQPSVRVIFNSLTRESKRKLEEILQQWSQWHAGRGLSSKDSHAVLVSGEETYFPALRVGLDKPSAVTFWVDNQTSIRPSKEFVPLDGTSVPFYDRGFSSALCLGDGSSNLDGKEEKFEDSRCFNCGSYSHALKDCPRPRDIVAVNNARKQHQSRKNQHANSRNSTRYYQSSRGGKYEGLMPGVLVPETRKLLGLGELDPPPWLQRMREIGYPPGYLEEEDQPSGITIFGEEENNEEGEEGEILGASQGEPSRKMSVDYPGINAPIPDNADERLWAASSSSSNLSRDHPRQWHNHSSENVSRRHYRESRSSRDLGDEGPPGRDTRSRFHHQYDNSSENASRRHYQEPRWTRDMEDIGPPSADAGTRSQHRYNHSYEDLSRGRYHEPRWSRDLEDEGPPGCDAGTSPSLSHHFRGHADYESGYSSLSPRASPLIPRSPNFGRSLSDRGRRSPLVNDGTPRYDKVGGFQYPSPR